MLSRPRFTSSRQILLAVILGSVAGLVISVAQNSSVLAAMAGETARVLGDVFLVGAQLLAVPLVVADGVEALVGLESTRGLGRLGWKIGLGSLGTCLLAVMVSWVLTGVLRSGFPLDRLLPASPGSWALAAAGDRVEVRTSDFSTFFWPALVALGLGFGFYRNHIGEGRARLLLRLWRGVDDVASLFAAWAWRIVPYGVLFVACSLTAKIGAPRLFDSESLAVLGCVLLCWVVYALGVLPAALWLATRINPWKYARAWMPAILTAGGTASLPAALPLSLEVARRHTGISRRIGGVVFPVGAAVWRDGATLGWVALAVSHAVASPSHPGGVQVAMVALGTGAAVAVGGGFGGGRMPIYLLYFILHEYARGGINVSFVLALGVVIESGGAAVSLWSQACVAAMIAHSEGERDLLTPRPPDDPFFGERRSLDFV